MTAPCLSFAFVGKLSANPLMAAFGLAGWAARQNRVRSCNGANWIGVGKWIGLLQTFYHWRFYRGKYHSRRH